MGNLVDRYTPSDPYPRSLLALVLSSVPLTLFLFGVVVVVNMYRTTEAIQGIPGLTLAVLFVSVLVSSHLAHSLVRDVAERAGSGHDHAADDEGSVTSSADLSATVQSHRPERDPEVTLRHRYAAGELTDEEFARMAEALADHRTSNTPPGNTAESSGRRVETTDSI